MSNIYIQEPPTSGKVLLETTVGDIDIELWAKETPKACRNFIQLCMEGYYNGTIFHRVIKGFIVQGGDPKGDGTGGESIYGKPFQDELHSRLRFSRRGLIAMCNAGIPHDNGSQFFFTLAACPHLQGKHTIFGKVMGETLFNMLKLEDSLVDHDDKPMYPHKILKAVVLSNPFPDIVPRILPNSAKSGKDGDEGEGGRKKKDKKSRSGVKDFKLLSFGAEAEEDEEEVAEVNKKLSNKGKSTHDLLSDPKLSSEPAVDPKAIKGGEDSDETSSEEEDVESGNEKWTKNEQSHSERAERVRNKLREAKNVDAPRIPSREFEEDDEEEYSLNQDKKKESIKRAEEIREEIRRLKKEMKGEKKAREDSVDTKEKTVEKTKVDLKEAESNEILKDYMKEQECFTAKHQEIPPKGSKREAHTMSMLKNFHKRLKMAKEKVLEEGDGAEEDSASKDALDDKEDLDGHASDNWLVHKLVGDEDDTVLARDANKAKGDEWFDIHDPRNPINQRRREASKQAMLSKKASSLAKQAELR